jgi:glycogen debranching enzyme
MRSAPFNFLPFAFFIFHFCFSQSLLDPLAIEVRGASREFAYTNRETAYFYGETNSDHKNSWQGFNVFGTKFLDDYTIWVDGKRLRRETATAIVCPDYLKRTYAGGIVEELRLADSVALFSLTIATPKPTSIQVFPIFKNNRGLKGLRLVARQKGILLGREDMLKKKTHAPAWLGIHGVGLSPEINPTQSPRPVPELVLSSRSRSVHRIAFVVANSVGSGERMLASYLRSPESFHVARRTRMETLLRQTYVETDNARFNKALAWAKLSLDALMMNQGTKGIFAGLPWFNDYWGRDTFIALPGATLVQGRFIEAREIFRSFAALQQRDTSSANYGRIPNRVTTTDIGYNTADGTPRFVAMAREYVERSGDTAFVREIYPTIFRSIEGSLKYHADSLGFLTHGDQETWMDAAGPKGCWSPRGNRANDIQALWAQQLRAGIWFAVRLSDSTSARRWNERLFLLEKNFSHHFFSQGIFTDHLNLDGSKDAQLRANQIFLAALLSEGQRARILHSVVNNLTYEYGVASLAQTDEAFHPYHQHEPFYPKDAAYHNGAVWTWLQGPVISELCYFGKHDLAWKLTENSVHQILDRDAVGTQSELLDAVARPGETEPRSSGTFSQAWNLAEFIRNFYDDYLGIRVSLLNHHLVLRPMLPHSITRIKATINLSGRALPIEVQRRSGSVFISIDGTNLRKGGTAEIILPRTSSGKERITFAIPPNSRTIFRSHAGLQSFYLNEVRSDDFIHSKETIFASSDLDSLRFANPVLREKLKSLEGPDYKILSHAAVKTTNRLATKLISIPDARGDDVGTGAYRYPLNANFVKGCLDITRFVVSTDEKNAYFTMKFRSLANPGWHPEYGFQLTYIAIAIDEDGIWNSGKIFVGHNANYPIEKFHAYEKLLLIGGGVQLEDKNGKILCAYVPTPSDITNPLGNAETGTVSFAIPISYLGTPSESWTWAVLVGAQDDHGGAGIGEFRNVNADAGEWSGGGKKSVSDPNVYDVLVAPSAYK